MIRNHSRIEKRAAFTLVELMVVILIIAVLVSMLLAGVSAAMRRIPVVQTSTEIRELEVALQAFMTDYNLDAPPPSYLALYEGGTTTSPVLQGASAAFLTKVFGKNLGSQPPYWVDWNGNGIWDGPHFLEGEQCLVFYLGGINNMGFSTNNMNPSQAGGKRKGPYFQFQTSRLVPGNIVNSALNPFPVYIDSWQVKSAQHPAPYANGVPYAYFSSQGLNNSGYLTNRLGVYQRHILDCVSLNAIPYWTAQNAAGIATTFTNSNTYQIISAGKDGKFGGGLWSPAGGATGAGADDQTNFSAGQLGAGQS